MYDFINRIENWFIKQRYYIKRRLNKTNLCGVFTDVNKWKFCKAISNPTFTVEEIISPINKVHYINEDGEQWLKPKWTPSLPKYSYEYPWGGELEKNYSKNDPLLIHVDPIFGALELHMDIRNNTVYHSMLHSNFELPKSYRVEVTARLGNTPGMMSAIWIVSHDGVFEPDLVERVGGDKYPYITLHNSNSYANKGWMSRDNIIRDKKLEPHRGFITYCIEHDINKGVTKFYIGNTLVRKFNRTSTAPQYLLFTIFADRPMDTSLDYARLETEINSVRIFEKI